MRMLDRRSALKTALIAASAGTAAVIAPSAFAKTENAAPPVNAADPDAQLDNILTSLEALPEDLKNADPGTTTDYSTRLHKELDGLKVVDTGQSIQKDVAIQYGFGWQCFAEVAGVIVTYGLPVAKVIKWLRDARALYGGVEGIWWAIRTGMAAGEIGEEAVAVLEGLLGVGGVINTCFG